MGSIPPELWGRAISAAVVPVVIISACGLLCLAFYNRLATIVGRLRVFQQESLRDQQALLSKSDRGETQVLARERVKQAVDVIRRQMGELMRRARWIRWTLFGLLSAIGCLILCSLTVGLSVFWPWTLYAAGPLFLAGLGCMFAGLVFAVIELRVALDPVELGTEFVERLASAVPGTAKLPRVSGEPAAEGPLDPGSEGPAGGAT